MSYPSSSFASLLYSGSVDILTLLIIALLFVLHPIDCTPNSTVSDLIHQTNLNVFKFANVSHDAYYEQSVNVTKPKHFVYSLNEAKWDEHQYIAQICYEEWAGVGGQTCTATLVDNNTVVTSTSCVPSRLSNYVSFVVHHLARHRLTNRLELLTRNVANVRANYWSCSSSHFGYTFLELSPYSSLDQYELVTMQNESLRQKDESKPTSQFQYVRLVSLVSPLSLDQDYNYEYGDFSCLNVDMNETKLVQLDTLASLDYVYQDRHRVYDCAIFNWTTVNIDLNHRIGQFQGCALLDYETGRVLGVGFVELFRNHLAKSVSTIKVAIFSADTFTTSDCWSFSHADHSALIGFGVFFGLCCLLYAYHEYHRRFHRIVRTLDDIQQQDEHEMIDMNEPNEADNNLPLQVVLMDISNHRWCFFCHALKKDCQVSGPNVEEGNA